MELNQDVKRKHRQEILAQQKEWLVTEGNSLGRLAKDRKDWVSQARVIWEAARKETEPLVLINLLRYQSARNSNSWEGVSVPLEKAIQQCVERSKSQGKDVALELIRHLLVYTIRSYTYEKG